jgi:hypothetical protein
MRIRMQSNVPDAWVIGAIVLAGAAIVLAISAVRLGAVDQRPASPLDAPTVAPTALPAIVDHAVPPTGSSGIFQPGASPVRTFIPEESPLPNGSAAPGRKTPDLPPPGYVKPEQN